MSTKTAVPPEPPVGTWVRDRHGAVSYHQTPGGWGQPGIVPAARWDRMWEARGPLVECGPWGAELTEAETALRSSTGRELLRAAYRLTHQIDASSKARIAEIDRTEALRAQRDLIDAELLRRLGEQP